MSRSISLLAAALLGLMVQLVPALAADEKLLAKDVGFSFEGPFGTFDRAQVQRGYQVYKEVCAACHSMSLCAIAISASQAARSFRRAGQGDCGGVQGDRRAGRGGQHVRAPALPSDAFVKPFPNDNAARAANGGALPTDLSLITKSRAGWSGSLKTLYTTQLIKGMGGPEYVYSVLTGYQDPPELAAEAPEGKHYNPYFENGHWIGMPPPLTEGGVTYADGTQATVDQMAKDVSAFLAGRAENGGAQAHRPGDGLSSGVRGAALSGQAADLGRHEVREAVGIRQ